MRDLPLVLRDLMTVAGAGRRPLVDLRAARSHRDPNDVRFVTDDLSRFLDVLRSTTGAVSRDTLVQRYLGPQTQGLREFRHRRPQAFRGLHHFTRRRAAFLDSIRPTLQSLRDDPGWRDRTRAHFETLRGLYPAARFPDVFLAVGNLRAPGTAGLSGLFIAAECFTLDTADLRGLRREEHSALRPAATLPFVIVHELAHTLQWRRWGANAARTLLDVTLHDGVADYLAARVTGELPFGPYFEFGLAHESRLWAEFVREMHRPYAGRWMYEGGRVAGRPADLGYFLGYRIAQAYASRIGDDRRAVRDLLDIRDAVALLRASGYAGRGDASPASPI